MPSATFVTATRIGFAARGLMYLLVAYFALTVGLSEDGAEALEHLRSGWGRILLAVMALGFLSYGAWRLTEAFVDGEGNGSNAKGIVIRIAGAVSGLVHLGLSIYAVKLAAGIGGSKGGGDGPEEKAATALSLPGGEIILAVAAGALVLMGIFQFVRAVRLGFLKHLDQRIASRSWVAWAGRAGYSARGVIFVLIGVFLWRAMQSENAAEAGGMGEALASLPGALYTIVAIGLLLFGLFSLIEARYRHISNPRLLARIKAANEPLTRP